MNCPQCGRGLAQGARKCVFCGHGTQVRPREQLSIPRPAGGETPRRRFMSAWVKFLLFAGIIAAGAYMAYRHVPEIKKIVDETLAGIL